MRGGGAVEEELLHLGGAEMRLVDDLALSALRERAIFVADLRL